MSGCIRSSGLSLSPPRAASIPCPNKHVQRPPMHSDHAQNLGQQSNPSEPLYKAEMRPCSSPNAAANLDDYGI
jgi:hypothetical protein